LLITYVYIRCTTTKHNNCFKSLPLLNLIYQVSDKRLLERCGTGKGFLSETGTSSVRPPGLRIRKAEDWTMQTWSADVQQIDETGNVLSTIGSQGLRKQTDFGPELN
jgi:hypothetical protein